MYKFIDLDTGLPAALNKIKTWVNSKLASKQDAINDLATIRSGAALGATAIQSHQSIKTLNGTSLVGTGNVNIPAGVTPHIDETTGNWFIGTNDTGVHAQGPTGNVTVSDGVAQISIINDLTTGGSGDALSAEMGKVLGARQVYVTEDEDHININISSSLPTISVSPLTLGFNAIVGGNQTKTITVTGENLSQNVSIELDGSTMFVLSTSSITPVSGAVNSTVNVTYYPVGSTTQNATISVKVGNNVASVIRLQGVAALPSMALSTSSLGIYGSGAATGTVYVIGSLLNGSVAVTTDSNDFTVSPSAISAADINAASATGVPVTITRASGATDVSCTVTFTDSQDSLSATLAVSYEESLEVGDIFFKGGFRWKVLTSSTIELEHSTGDTSSASTYTGDIVTIPSSVTWAGIDYTVTSIGNSAFYKCSQVRQIVLPDTVTNLAYRAFTEMSALQYVNMPDSISTVVNYMTSCNSLVEFTIPKNATHSATWCYSSCTFGTLIVKAGTTNPFSQNYTLSQSTVGTFRIESTSGTAGNGVIFLNGNAFYSTTRRITKLQVPTGMKTYYSDRSNAYVQRWLKALGWNGSDDGTNANDTYNKAIATIEEITV